MTAAGDEPRRLERAVGAYIAFLDSGETRAAFLARHSDLRDLLEAMLAEPPPEPHPGQDRTLGDFRLLREVGRGGMGVVYEARQLSLDRRVALKVLPPHLTQRASTVARFRREAAVMAGLDHPNIVRVLAVGLDGDTHWIAMEFVEGTPLDRILRERAGGAERTPTWTRQAVEIAYQVAGALEHAHRAGIVHRDVKPSNVLLRADGTAVLTDFGLARDAELPSMTLPGGRAGTPFYMSPEQAAGDSAKVDHRTDVFSLGVALYELLTARRPFDGDTTEAVLHGILIREAPDPRRYNATLPPDLAAVVLRAIEKEPHFRYATAGDFADDLRAWLALRPVKARPASLVLRLRRWTRREPVKAALVAILAAGVPTLAGLLGYLVARAPEIRAGQEKLLEDLLEQGLALGAGSHREHPNAREAFDQVLALSPEHEEGLAGMALVVERWEGGVAPACAFLDAHPDALARSRALRRLRAFLLPAGPDRTENLARIEAELGPPLGALEHLMAGLIERGRAEAGEAAALRRCIEHYSLATRLSPRPRLSFYLTMADVLRWSDDREARLETARVLEELWPRSSRAWNWIGELLRGIEPSRSVAAYRRGLQIFPDESGLLLNLTDALLEASEPDEALAILQRHMALYPGYGLAFVSLGECELAKGRVDEAMAAFERAVALGQDPVIVDARYGAALARVGRPLEARVRLERAVDPLRTQPRVACDLAEVLLQLGEPQAARARIEAAFGFGARDARVHDLLVRSLRELGDETALRTEEQRWAQAEPQE